MGNQDLTSQLWKTDGTDEGTIRISGVGSISQLTVMGDALYFKASGSSCGGKELWKTDGTSDGTVCVKDINPGSDSSDPETLLQPEVLCFSMLMTELTEENYGKVMVQKMARS